MLPVDIGSAIAEQMIEAVERAGFRHARQIDLRKEDFLAIGAGRTGYWPALRTDDKAAADEGLAALDTDPVGAGDVETVGVGRRLVEDIGHRLGNAFRPGHRYPVGGDADQFGAGQRQLTKRFRKPPVVADGDADTAEGQVEYRQPEIAFSEQTVFVVPQMKLAVFADVSLGTTEKSAVVKPVAILLGNAADDVKAKLPARRQSVSALAPPGTGAANAATSSPSRKL